MDCSTPCCLNLVSPSTCSDSSSSSSVLSFSFTTPTPLITPHNQENNELPKTSSVEKKKKKLPPSKYKGVVPQSNGRWGAQIYNGHKRVWLGTFDHEYQAAAAHDLAAICFRGVQAAVNFSAHHHVSRPHHLQFLACHSLAQVVTMLRTHTYQAELARFMTTKKPPDHPDPTHGSGCSRRGTLHRLVIPKFHAKRDLPELKKCEKKGMMLTFEDEGGERVWRFKYCYWRGSKNYVLTKGWSHFVKEKGLKPGDVVAFCSSLISPSHKRLYIESSLSSSLISDSSVVLPGLEVSATRPGDCGSSSSITDHSNGSGSDHGGSNMLRLFGVDIRVGAGRN
ncbi:hypothetical protein Cgig2_009548 [Carnegiea gigantea]|uniref:Uncharacterized protein n=1 Tax=Carnegiea gigantea TaxID=171969 RepID=A0A9Q1QFB6_9CARY|nr:hypothetical protein Cgig2_009548 [Carnegiea gigantea]